MKLRVGDKIYFGTERSKVFHIGIVKKYLSTGFLYPASFINKLYIDSFCWNESLHERILESPDFRPLRKATNTMYFDRDEEPVIFYGYASKELIHRCRDLAFCCKCKMKLLKQEKCKMHTGVYIKRGETIAFITGEDKGKIFRYSWVAPNHSK